MTATTRALPISYNAGGTESEQALDGFASALADPTQITIAASRSPSYSPAQQRLLRDRTEQADPSVQCGSGNAGRCSSTRPPSPPPSRIRNSTRITTIATPSQR